MTYLCNRLTVSLNSHALTDAKKPLVSNCVNLVRRVDIVPSSSRRKVSVIDSTCLYIPMVSDFAMKVSRLGGVHSTISWSMNPLLVLHCRWAPSPVVSPTIVHSLGVGTPSLKHHGAAVGMLASQRNFQTLSAGARTRTDVVTSTFTFAHRMPSGGAFLPGPRVSCPLAFQGLSTAGWPGRGTWPARFSRFLLNRLDLS